MLSRISWHLSAQDCVNSICFCLHTKYLSLVSSASLFVLHVKTIVILELRPHKFKMASSWCLFSTLWFTFFYSCLCICYLEFFHTIDFILLFSSPRSFPPPYLPNFMFCLSERKIKTNKNTQREKLFRDSVSKQQVGIDLRRFRVIHMSGCQWRRRTAEACRAHDVIQWSWELTT